MIYIYLQDLLPLYVSPTSTPRAWVSNLIPTSYQLAFSQAFDFLFLFINSAFKSDRHFAVLSIKIIINRAVYNCKWRSIPSDHPEEKGVSQPLLLAQLPIAPSVAAYRKSYWNPSHITQGSTPIPTFSSSKVKPRPALTLVLYLKVGQRTIGRRAPATGRGAICKALFTRATRLRFLRPGWSNHVLT